MSDRARRAVGLTLAAMLIGSWLALEGYALFYARLGGTGLLLALPLVCLICWLDVGLFIIAHDAMHGSLAPHWPRTNHLVGQAAIALYAGFDFNRLRASHLAHHAAPGTSLDPDFDAEHPSDAWPWYARFMSRYFGAPEFVRLSLVLGVALLVGARPEKLAIFWAVPALLSSFQLFFFGTYLPHRRSDQPFADHHQARSSNFSWLLSLLTCFHFGRHHEHHLRPELPWWLLPRADRLPVPLR